MSDHLAKLRAIVEALGQRVGVYDRQDARNQIADLAPELLAVAEAAQAIPSADLAGGDSAVEHLEDALAALLAKLEGLP